MINRREKIAWSTNAIISIFTALIGRANKPASLDSTPSPDVRKTSWPVITAGLRCSCWSTCITYPRACSITNLRCTTKLPGDDHKYSLIESTLVNIFDQSRNRLIINPGSEFHSIKNMLIYRMVVPITNSSTKGTAKTSS